MAVLAFLVLFLAMTGHSSITGCVFPSSASAASTSTTPTTTTPSSTTTPTTTTTTPTTTSPYTTTPSTGVLGGIGTGVGPSGAGINTDESHGGLRLLDTTFFSFSMILFFTGCMVWWG
ncbi:hypothetical protein F2P56_003810 [Juglans regia]|uniref:Uncharacterized protein n=1 Tax=Juglans regia TaxID=51240 RepID=A0A834D5J5_JUGRE|nr:hypothetical protein F2P56_003810 [Juglans regia]